MKKLLSVLVLLLTGCASNQPSVKTGDPSDHWLQGSLTRMEDGKVFSFRIQKVWVAGGSATGGVAAIDPITHERFSGQYTGMLAGGHANAWATANVSANNGVNVSANGFAASNWRSDTANAKAMMTDGKGASIAIQMDIHAGWSPHGMGQGMDNSGRHYQVLF